MIEIDVQSMNYEALYKAFCTLFPDIAGHVNEWYPQDWHALQLLFKDRPPLIFFFNSENDWGLETARSYFRRAN